MTEFLADGPHWHLRSWSFFCLPLLHCGWTDRLLNRWIPLMQFLRIKCWWWMTHVDLQKRFRYTMCVPNAWRPFLQRGDAKECLSTPSWIWWGGNHTGWLVTWEISTAYRFNILKILWIVRTIYFILQFLYSARKCQSSVLILDEFSSCQSVECRTPENFLILPFQWDFFDELDQNPTFAAIVVLEGVVALLRLELLEIRVD